MVSIWQPGQLLFAGFEGTQVPGDLARLIAEGRVGGVILFARNLRDPHQVRALTRELHSHAPEDAPLLIAIDQEGGRVQRLPEPWTQWPPMRGVGNADDLELTRAVATSLARELSDLGIFLDFAPVMDVDTNPKNPVIGDRSFGRDPEHVANHGTAFITAMQEANVAACAKHFPGHGDTSTDSHLELPRLDHDLDRLRRVELPPFRTAVDANVASIMTAHVLFPRLDKKRPATLSPDVMALLRQELGFEGVVFSDDLEMKAVAAHFGPEQLVSGCLEAGVDALLVCHDASLRLEVLRRLERASDGVVEGCVSRVVELKQRYARALPAGREPGDEAAGPPPYDDHLALAGRVPALER
jgi:beta-N-acetylhexosaminidase